MDAGRVRQHLLAISRRREEDNQDLQAAFLELYDMRLRLDRHAARLVADGAAYEAGLVKASGRMVESVLDALTPVIGPMAEQAG